MKKTGWLALVPLDFEEMVFWLLQREGFFNVIWHGQSGGDKGRDITCQRLEVFGPRVVAHNCVVQCKKYAGRVQRAKLYEDILKASEHHPDYFILATTGIVGSSTKDWFNSQGSTFGFRLVLWERMDLEILLERHQDLRAKFLQIPVEPDLLLKQLANESHLLAGADKVLLKPTVRRAVTGAYQMAISHSNLFTLAHLLIALLRMDRACTRVLFLKHGIEPERLASALENAFAQQPENTAYHRELQVSGSVRQAIEAAIRLMTSLGESVLSERTLVWALLMQQQSGTVEFLATKCGINIGQLLSTLSKLFFTAHERNSLAAYRRLRSETMSSARRADTKQIFLPAGTPGAFPW